jgi:3-oxoacyl-[acyl-carrier-protein] synthase II
MEKRRVVITGRGAISPIGNDVKTTWENAKNGVNGIDFIKSYDTSDHDVKIAGEIKDFDFVGYFGKKAMKRMDRFVMHAMIASKEAVEDANLSFDGKDTSRYGVFYGSGIGGLNMIAEQEDKAKEKGYNRISPFFIPSAIINIAAGNIAIEYGLKGIATSCVTACARASNSIGEAFHKIRDGYLDLAITGGSEATVIPLGIAGFSVIQALNKSNDPNRASTPFDKERSGFVMGEGAATLVLESLEHAKARNAKIYGEIVGYGATCDAYHITSPSEDGEGAMNSMLNAIADASLKVTDVNYINAHGTSTPLNDSIETVAIKRAFKDHVDKIKISSTKSMTGHLLGASGAIEALFCVEALRDDFVPPTINYRHFDPACDLDYTVNEGVAMKLDVALSNSLGFGGHNATLVFKKYKEEGYVK